MDIYIVELQNTYSNLYLICSAPLIIVRTTSINHRRMKSWISGNALCSLSTQMSWQSTLSLGCGGAWLWKYDHFLNHWIPLNHENGRKDKKARTSTNLFVCIFSTWCFFSCWGCSSLLFPSCAVVARLPARCMFFKTMRWKWLFLRLAMSCKCSLNH